MTPTRMGESALKALALLALIGAARPDAALASEPRLVLLDALETELERSMKGLRGEGLDRPYFMAYSLKDTRTTVIIGKYGALESRDDQHYRQAYAEVRIGDYDFDNHAPLEGESTRRSDAFTSWSAPVDDDPMALRQTFWLLTDSVYKDAMSSYIAKQGTRIFLPEERSAVPSFAEAEVVEHIDPVRDVAFDADVWEAQVRETTATLAAEPTLIDSSVRVAAEHEVRYFINSEGTRVITEHTHYGVFLHATARADDGMLLTHDRSFYARSPGQLPSGEALARETATLIEELRALREAEPMEDYTGPALLAPEAAGVLFHEAVGHRLEGERMLRDSDGKTFRGQEEREVLPVFLSLTDDPTLEQLDGVELSGFYPIDDEGVPAERVDLIRDGALSDILLSRSPVRRKDHSNGHGRAQGNYKPMARMSNLLISASPEAQVDEASLKALLLEEVRRQGKPYGLLILDIEGGASNTSNFGYQAFSGTPRRVYRVDAATGEETLVRGVEVVGTPLGALSRVIAVGATREVFNGYCGAESGYVPVSTVSPAVLVSEIELQRAPGAAERGPILSAPMAE